MPDMQTALKEALNEWDDSLGRHQVEKQQPTPLPEVTQMQTVSTKPNPRGQRPRPENEFLRRELFNHIKGNPESCVQDLLDCGFDNKTYHFLTELYEKGKLNRGTKRALRPIRGGHISERDVFAYTVAVKEYDDETTHVPKRVIKKRKSKLVKRAAQPAQGIAALPVEKTKEESERIGRPVRYEAIPEPIKPVAIPLTADYIMNNINIAEGKKLYSALYNIFG